MLSWVCVECSDFTPEWERIADFLAIQLACKAVARISRPGYGAWGICIADELNRLDPGVRPFSLAGLQVIEHLERFAWRWVRPVARFVQSALA